MNSLNYNFTDRWKCRKCIKREAVLDGPKINWEDALVSTWISPSNCLRKAFLSGFFCENGGFVLLLFLWIRCVCEHRSSADSNGS